MRPGPVVFLLLAPIVLAGCDSLPGEVPPPPEEFPRHALRFSGEDALEAVRTQVLAPNGSVQYRIPGTPSHARVSQWIEHEMALLGYETQYQSWGKEYACRETPLRNVLALRQGATNRTVVLLAHYDTRPVADRDPDPALRLSPVPGANDGGSGVAVLLELADALRGRAANLTLLFAFVDAEDGGDLPREAYPCSTGWIMGSLRFMNLFPRAVANWTEGVLVVDMVGDTNLSMKKEGYTAKGPGAYLQDHLFDVGAKLGYGDVFVDAPGDDITDDHRAFLDPPAVQRFGRALPAVDLIHLDDEGPSVFHDTWHTTRDDLDHVSAASLEAVGRTIEHTLLDMDPAPLPGAPATPATT